MVIFHGNDSSLLCLERMERVVNCFKNGIFLWESQLLELTRNSNTVVNCFQIDIFL